MENTEITVANQNLYVSPVVGIDEAKSKFEMVRKYTADCLTKYIDYGKVPGVSKPSLLKPGAEKICSLFGLTPKFTCVDKIMNWTGEGNPDNEPFFYFEYRCDLYRGGEFVASCDASCNSWEKKYRYRNADLLCPNCGEPLRKSKNKDEYYCWTKTGGCGATFGTKDPQITNQRAGSKKNMDTAEQVNTFQKMAQKRAYVGATLIACNLSEYYTQDVEDMDTDSVAPEQQPFFEGEFTEVEQPQPQPKPEFDEKAFLSNWHKPDGVPAMSTLNAEKMTDSKGNPYGEKTTKDLFYMLRAITKKIDTLDDDQKAEYQLKVSAICQILETRKVKNGLAPEQNDPFVGK